MALAHPHHCSKGWQHLSDPLQTGPDLEERQIQLIADSQYTLSAELSNDKLILSHHLPCASLKSSGEKSLMDLLKVVGA